MDIKKNLTICKKCILPDSFPGIKFDNYGLCNHCVREKNSVSYTNEKKSEYKLKFNQLIAENLNGSGVYDAIMAFSGGKDSTYTLKILKEKYNLRILAFTFDNQFISPYALKNIKRVTDKLEVDLIIFRLPLNLAKEIFTLTAQEDIFPKPNLLRASSICTACIGFVKSIILKTALEMSIPLVAFGWSPGQAPIQSAIMKTNPGLIKQNQKALQKAFPAQITEKIKQYFVPSSYYDDFKERFPYNIHPLAFFDYNEKDIIKNIESIGWNAPEDTDTNSSNCLLNAFANQCHITRTGFHPYVWEIANMVRRGIIDRDEGIEKIYTDQNQEMVNFAKEKLNL